MSDNNINPYEEYTDSLQDISNDISEIKKLYGDYFSKVNEMLDAQKTCKQAISKSLAQLDHLESSVKNLTLSSKTDSHEKPVETIQEQIAMNQNKLREMMVQLPRKNGAYLNVILGDVNVCLLNKAAKYDYKVKYERFKLTVTMITMFLSFLLLTVFRNRVMDEAFHFLLVWYYCTLTVREHILIVNGSKIKTWWIVHHFITTVCAGILLQWPDGIAYQTFRDTFMRFVLFLSMVNIMQYYYQTGVLYRLRALGQGDTMEVTVDGFRSWMWKGLSFILPFLFLTYLFQLYNCYFLYKLSLEPTTVEWEVPIMSFLFFVLFAGNSYTTGLVVFHKFIENRNLSLRNFIYTHRYKMRQQNKEQ